MEVANRKVLFINVLLSVFLLMAMTVTVVHAGTPQSLKKSIDSKGSKTVDFNERLHLICMREEKNWPETFILP